jgi:hypothetical protein
MTKESHADYTFYNDDEHLYLSLFFGLPFFLTQFT